MVALWQPKTGANRELYRDKLPWSGKMAAASLCRVFLGQMAIYHVLVLMKGY